MKKVIVIGASSGMGRDIVKQLSARGCEVGLAARSLDELEKLQKELPGSSHVECIDIAYHEGAIDRMRGMIRHMGGVDTFIISAGIDIYNKDLDWKKEKEVIDINVAGFAAVAGAAYKYLRENGGGRLAAISSVAALRGNAWDISYNASKAFVSNYMEGLRLHARLKKTKVKIIDIRPGFVATPMTAGNKGMFWVSSSQQAARDIIKAVKKGKPIAYISPRWRIIGAAMRHMPDWMYAKF